MEGGMSHGGWEQWEGYWGQGRYGTDLPAAHLPAGLQSRDHERGDRLDNRPGQLQQGLAPMAQLHLSPVCYLGQHAGISHLGGHFHLGGLNLLGVLNQLESLNHVGSLLYIQCIFLGVRVFQDS